MGARYLRIVLVCAAVAAAIVAVSLVIVFYAQLPGTIPAHIAANGAASGALPKWMVFLPAAIEIAIIAILLSGAGNWRNVRGDAAKACTWASVAAASWLLTRVEYMQIQAALHPGASLTLQPYDFALIGAILGGAVVAMLLSWFNEDFAA